MLEEEQKVRLYIDILKCGVGEEISNYACEKIIFLLETQKVKCILPDSVLDKLVKYVKDEINDELKRILFIQYLYCDGYGVNIRFMKKIFKAKTPDINKLFGYLAPLKRRRYEGDYRVNMTENFEVLIFDSEPNKTEIEILKIALEELGIEYLYKFSDFLCAPTYEKFQELRRKIGEEERYLAVEYEKSLRYYTDTLDIETEEDFKRILSKKQYDYQQITNGNYQELFFGNANVKYTYSARCSDSVFDELVEKGLINYENISNLNDDFLRAYMFTLRVQLESTRSLKTITDKQVNNFVKIASEMIKRKICDSMFNEVYAVLMTSKFKKKFWEQNPEFQIVNCIVKERIIPYGLSREISCIKSEDLEEILCNIINKMVSSEKEDNYLPLFLRLIDEKIDIRKCVSEEQVRQLELIEYNEDINILGVHILKMCICETESAEAIINNIFKLEVPKVFSLDILLKVLRCCDVISKEELLTRAYLRLQEESFSESEAIREKYLKEMFELRENMSSISFLP